MNQRISRFPKTQILIYAIFLCSGCQLLRGGKIVGNKSTQARSTSSDNPIYQPAFFFAPDLLQAVRDGDTAKVQKLLVYGINPLATFDYKYNLLFLAAENGYAEVIQALAATGLPIIIIKILTSQDANPLQREVTILLKYRSKVLRTAS